MNKKIKIPLGPSIKRIIDLIGIKLNNITDVANTIVISGAPRTGTTLLMEILSTLPRYKTIFEPFHPDRFPYAASLGFFHRVYIPPEKDNELLQEYLKAVFTGEILSILPEYPLSRFEKVYKRLIYDGIIAKFTRANRLLPWISKRFKMKVIYLVIRHPCATISSQLKTGWIGYSRDIEHEIRRGNVELLRKIVLNGFLTTPVLEEMTEIIKKIGKMSKEELLAVEWSLDYLIPLRVFDRHNWHLVVYEEMMVNPEKILEGIFNRIDRKMPKRVYRMITEPSVTSGETKIDTTKQIQKWKKYLSKYQVEKILNIVHLFGLDFYTEEVEPNYKELRQMIN